MPAGRPPHPPTIDVQIDHEIIRTFYADTPMRELLDLLPHRTEKWVYKTAQQLGIKRAKWLIRENGKIQPRNDLWTPHEEAELLRKWPIFGMKTRIEGRNPYAIERRAYQLGARFNRKRKQLTINNIWIYNAPTNTNTKHLV